MTNGLPRGAKFLVDFERFLKAITGFFEIFLLQVNEARLVMGLIKAGLGCDDALVALQCPR